MLHVIFTYVWLKFLVNVGKYSSHMELICVIIRFIDSHWNNDKSSNPTNKKHHVISDKFRYLVTWTYLEEIVLFSRVFFNKKQTWICLRCSEKKQKNTLPRTGGLMIIYHGKM